MEQQPIFIKPENFKTNYKAITGPGKYQLTVLSVSNKTFYNPALKREEYIVNFYACFPSRMPQDAVDYIAECIQNNESIAITKIPKANMRVSTTGYVPATGEIVNVIVEMVPNKDKTGMVPAFKSISPLPVKSLDNSWDFLKPKVEDIEAVQTSSNTPAIEAPAEVVTIDEAGDDLPF